LRSATIFSLVKELYASLAYEEVMTFVEDYGGLE